MTIKSVIQCIFDDDMDGGGDDDNDTGNGPEWVPLTGGERDVGSVCSHRYTCHLSDMWTNLPLKHDDDDDDDNDIDDDDDDDDVCSHRCTCHLSDKRTNLLLNLDGDDDDQEVTRSTKKSQKGTKK